MNNVFVVVDNPMGSRLNLGIGINIKAESNIIAEILANIGTPHLKLADNFLSFVIPEHMAGYFKEALTRMGLRLLDVKSEEAQVLLKEYAEVFRKFSTSQI